MIRLRDRVRSAVVDHGPPLQLLRQAKLRSLLAPVAPDLDRLEASGVVLERGLLWVIFDNLPHLAAIHPALIPGERTAQVVRQSVPAAGYEDIAVDDVAGRRFVLIESARTADGGFRPQIDEYDASWRRIGRRWVELNLDRPNKGLEGLACVHRGGQGHLLALSEGNGNRGGRRGRRPGGGEIHVLAEQSAQWVVLDQIQLPEGLPFADYSGISVRGDRIAIVSQESSALWVGDLDPGSWQVIGGGRIHPFPQDDRGRTIYGTIEGVTWLDDQTVAAVSDRAKRNQSHRMHQTDESVHVFALPPAGGPNGATGDAAAAAGGTVGG
jgi:hypothetical protein